MAGSILQVNGLWKNFGGLTAVNDYALDLPEGITLGLIGPNGAGKTTIFNLISGIIRSDRGFVFFRGQDITRKRPDQITALGLTRTFQNLRLFSSLTVEQNLQVGAHLHVTYGFVSKLFGFPQFYSQEKSLLRTVDRLLDVFGLTRYRRESASSLPYGLQRKLDMARALMTEPKVILLDEPSSGMNTAEAEDLAVLVARISREYGVTMVIVEHRMPFVMGLADTIQVLDYGSILCEGSPEEIQNDPRVIEAYLGTGETVA